METDKTALKEIDQSVRQIQSGFRRLYKLNHMRNTLISGVTAKLGMLRKPLLLLLFDSGYLRFSSDGSIILDNDRDALVEVFKRFGYFLAETRAEGDAMFGVIGIGDDGDILAAEIAKSMKVNHLSCEIVQNKDKAISISYPFEGGVVKNRSFRDIPTFANILIVCPILVQDREWELLNTEIGILKSGFRTKQCKVSFLTLVLDEFWANVLDERNNLRAMVALHDLLRLYVREGRITDDDSVTILLKSCDAASANR